MREMEDSKLEWLGDVPSDWSLERFQWHLTEIKESNNPVQTTQVLSLTNKLGVVPYEEKGAQGNVAKENYDEYKLSYPDTIVANSMNILIGSVGICQYFGCVSPVYYVFKANKNSCLEFINYIFQTQPFQKELRRYANGILEIRLRLSSANILKRIAAFPSIEEQRKIVAFLDKKCKEVDTLIANQEAQIEKLKQYKQSLITEVVTKGLDPDATMKDSGFEWIGIIPTHWTIARKLSFQVKEDISYGIVKLFEPDDINGVKVIRCSDVLEGTIDPQNIRTVTKSVSDEYSRTILKGGEVLVNVRGSLGGCAVVPPEMAGYNIAREVAKITLKNALINRFVMYYMLSNAFVDYRTRYLSGSVYIGLNIELLSVCPIPMPSIFEQKQICGFLDEKCQSIDNLITLKYQKINKLNEYRKSLIYEYVTGKKLTR